MSATSGEAFDPVVLEVTSPVDYYVLTAALEEFAADQYHRADAERDAASETGRPSDENERRDQASRAHRMIADIERQIDANADIRRPRP